MRVLKLLVPAVILFMVYVANVNAQDSGNKKGDVYYEVEEMPKYPGGEEALRVDISKTVKYPEDAVKKGIEGKVYVTFVVNEQGKVVDSKIARGVDTSLDKEALRVVGELKTWTPGKQKGKPVKVSFTIPIKFALNDNKKKVTEVSDDEQVFRVVEDMPEFPGGNDQLRKYISENVKYPQTAKEKGIQGKVFVSFVVTKDGSITQTKVERGVDPVLDKEALRVVSELPQWKPGSQRGTKVNVQFTIPINFALDNSKEKKS